MAAFLGYEPELAGHIEGSDERPVPRDSAVLLGGGGDHAPGLLHHRGEECLDVLVGVAPLRSAARAILEGRDELATDRAVIALIDFVKVDGVALGIIGVVQAVPADRPLGAVEQNGIPAAPLAPALEPEEVTDFLQRQAAPALQDPDNQPVVQVVGSFDADALFHVSHLLSSSSRAAGLG